MSGRMDRRPMVMAKAAPDQKPSPMGGIPLQLGTGRVPDGGHGANNMVKPKSIFEGNASAQNMNQARMAPAYNEPRRSVVFARPSLGQESSATPAPPGSPPAPPTNIQEVLIREGGPEGLTRKEASDIAAALSAGIDASSMALSEGQTCVGVDGSSIEAAKDILSGMQRFGAVGNQTERLDLRPSELDLIEKVIECGGVYEKLKSADKSRTMAFVAGGLIIGAVILLVTTK